MWGFDPGSACGVSLGEYYPKLCKDSAGESKLDGQSTALELDTNSLFETLKERVLFLKEIGVSMPKKKCSLYSGKLKTL